MNQLWGGNHRKQICNLNPALAHGHVNVHMAAGKQRFCINFLQTHLNFIVISAILFILYMSTLAEFCSPVHLCFVPRTDLLHGFISLMLEGKPCPKIHEGELHEWEL